jgi:arylsulfatase A-like enzyme
MRRTILLFALSTLALFGALRAEERPNILFIYTDDLGYGDVGAFFDGPRPSGPLGGRMTPQLDRLAATGAKLTHHYTSAPVCAPARASLYSGRHQGHANIRNNQFDKALADNHTIATVLKQAGYATAIVGKWGLQGYVEGATPNWPAHPLNRGFDFYFGYIRHVDGHEQYPKEAPIRNRDNSPPRRRSPLHGEDNDVNPAIFGKEVWENRREISDTLDKCYTTDLFAARTKQWIIDHRRTRPDQPFFAFLSLATPHAAIEIPTMAYPEGGGLNGGLQWTGEPGRAINTAGGTVNSWMHPDFADATYDHDANPATPEIAWPDVYRRYATSVRRIDDTVADLAQLLRDLGIAEDTLIVFSSDNGPSLESYLKEDFSPEFFAGFGPFDGVKRDLWEGGIRTPTIAHWPGRIPQGVVTDAPSGQWDWLPTFAELAGLPTPALADGVSLVPALEGRPFSRGAAPLYFEYFNNVRTPDYPAFDASRRGGLRREMQAVRVGELMGVRYNIASAHDPFQIYNVVVDPKQARNLADDPAYAPLQRQLQALALQSRRPDTTAARPYDTAPMPAVAATPAGAGLVWRRFDGAFPWVPSTDGREPSATGSAPLPAPAAALADATGPAAIEYAGYLRIPVDGEYTFTLATETGAIVRLHQAVVFDADRGYTAGEKRTAAVRLEAGLHPIRIVARHPDRASAKIELAWSGPGLPERPLAPEDFRQP